MKPNMQKALRKWLVGTGATLSLALLFQQARTSEAFQAALQTKSVPVFNNGGSIGDDSTGTDSQADSSAADHSATDLQTPSNEGSTVQPDDQQSGDQQRTRGRHTFRSDDSSGEFGFRSETRAS